LCEDLLEPLQDTFGRIAIRSAFRSVEVNGYGNDMQRAKKAGYTCASNPANYAGHIWDRRDKDGFMGATACVVVPSFWDRFQEDGDWLRLACSDLHAAGRVIYAILSRQRGQSPV